MVNFYTRHHLAKEVETIGDGDIKIIGTVRFNNIDVANRPAVKEAVKMAKIQRGVLFLCHALTRGKMREN